MAERSAFWNPRLQDYVDGRLTPRERAEVAAELDMDPRLAADMERIQRDTDLLKAIGQEVLEEPVPERLRAVLERPAARPAPVTERRQRRNILGFDRMPQAAAVLLLLTTGVGIGWIGNDLAAPAPDAHDIILASATQAFSLYDDGDGYPVDFPPDRASELRGWIEREFQRDLEPPDLLDAGYAFEGGRLLPGNGARVGAFQFRSPGQGRLGVFFWPDQQTPARAPWQGQAAPDIAYETWSGSGFSIVVMGGEGATELASVAKRVFAFYQDVLEASSRSERGNQRLAATFGWTDQRASAGHLGEAHAAKGYEMNWDQIQGKWTELKGDVRARWGKLTDDDLEQAAGRRDELVGRLQQRYGMAREDAERQLDDWLAKL